MDVLVWFKRDLRIEDNAVLARAVGMGGRVLPVFIIEPGFWAERDASARQFRFLGECVAGLQGDLARLGAPLVLCRGEAVDVLRALTRATGIRHMVSQEETGNGWTYARDRAVGAWARGEGIAWEEVPQPGIVRRLGNRDGWAARRGRVIAKPQVETPEGLRGVSPDVQGAVDVLEHWPDARDMGLRFDPCPGRQKGGRAAALSSLGGFLTERGQDYRRAMSSPLEGAEACSRLSPHLAWGTVSVREAAHAAAARKAEVAGTRAGWIGAMRSFEARLAWRDHFMQKLEDAPALEHECLHSAYEGLRPREPDAACLAAWEAGETGLPFVDACMRSLNATGWINFRMRAMLVAVASYHLWLDWRASGPHLARMFTDYEPGIHWPQMQMQSGTTGMNTVRIYNPVKQGADQDPGGVFTRRWCPELREVPDAHLQTPWTWSGAGRLLGRGYPAPIVDPLRSAKAAREKVWAVRSGEAFRREARSIVTKHASRKDGGAGRHFVNDRETVARPGRGRKGAPGGSDAQLRLDL